MLGVTVSRDVAASADGVWAVLSDGWTYATWVVGASRVRQVDAAWPADGEAIKHSFGVWPLLINDTSSVLVSEPSRRLVLKARGWPMGEARVEIEIRSRGPGACTVNIAEDAVRGPGLVVPKPVRQALIAPRNREALKRLAYLAEGGARP